MMNRMIEVGVFGGLVQWVRGVPDGLEVRVYDYDVDGVNGSRIDIDGDGNRCVTAIYEGQGENDTSAPERSVP